MDFRGQQIAEWIFQIIILLCSVSNMFGWHLSLYYTLESNFYITQGCRLGCWVLSSRLHAHILCMCWGYHSVLCGEFNEFFLVSAHDCGKFKFAQCSFHLIKKICVPNWPFWNRHPIKWYDLVLFPCYFPQL
jgi:hypothetical protein